MRYLLLGTAIAALLVGCIGSELEVKDARSSRDAAALVVDVDVAPNTDIDGYCVRIAFWDGDDLLETTTTCSDADLDGGERVTHSFRTKHGGATCTTFTIETGISLDDDELPTITDPLPARKSEMDGLPFTSRDCP